MPKYRNIHTKMPNSDDINDMPDDFHRFFYTMFFIILDSEGRGYDKPMWLKSNAFPLREDVTSEMISAAMNWFEARKMIYRYEAGGKKCFYDPKFKDHQSGLSKESASVIPAPSPELLRSWLEVNHPELLTNSDPLGGSKSAPKTKTATKTNTKTATKTNSATDSPAHSEVESSQPVKLVGDPKNPPEAFPESDQLSKNPKKLDGPQVARLWNAALGSVQDGMSKAFFDTWLRPLKLGGLVGNQLRVIACNKNAMEMVQSRAGPQLENALSVCAGFKVDLVIESDASVFEERIKT